MESLGILCEPSRGPSSLFRPAIQGERLAYCMGSHSQSVAMWELKVGSGVLKVFSEFQEGNSEPEEGGSSRSKELDSGVGLAGFLGLVPALLAKGRFPHLESGVTVHFLSLL